MKSILIVSFFIVISSKLILSQSLSSKVFHPLSNAFGITLEAGGTIPQTDFKIDELEIMGRISIEYYFTSRSFHAFGIKLIGGGGLIKGETLSNEIVYPPVPDNFKTTFFLFGGGFVYTLRFGNGLPYLSGSATYTSFNPLDYNGYALPNNKLSVYKKTAMVYSCEAGIKFPFEDNWSLNLGTSLNFANTDYLDDIRTGKNNDAFIIFFTGISFYLGKNIDRDNDGIDDANDLCPDTPQGDIIDEIGCSVGNIIPYDYIYDIKRDQFLSNSIFTDGTTFCFQVNSFRSQNTAETLKNKVIILGYNAKVFNVTINNTEWFSVRVGYYASYGQTLENMTDFFRKNRLKLK